MKQVKIGLIGLGNMGMNHLRILTMLKGVEVSFAFDPNPKATANAQKTYGITVSNELTEEAISGLDGVIIASPTISHGNYIKMCAKHVNKIFVEKPLSSTHESSLDAISELGEDIVIQVGYIERFNPAVVSLRSLIGTQRVLNVDFTRTNKVSSRITDVDVIADLMIHDLDLALHMLGPVEQVEAYGFVNEDQVDYARAILKHKSGSFSTVTASRITEKRIREIEVTCQDMYIGCNLLSKEILINKQSVEQYYEHLSISARQEVIDVRPQEALLSELVTFVGLVRGGGGEFPGIDAALSSIKLADQIRTYIKETK